MYVYKVEELPSANLMSANNLFVELILGSNEIVKTRVRKGAGSSAVLKELLQVNYDPDDEDEKLIVNVKSQDMLVASEVASLELSNRDINMIISLHDVQQFRLFPQGKIWLGVSYVEEGGEYSGEGGGPFSSIMNYVTGMGTRAPSNPNPNTIRTSMV